MDREYDTQPKSSPKNPYKSTPKQNKIPEGLNSNNSPKDDDMRDSHSRKGEHADEFNNIFRQLKKINKQQSKLMESITTFQASTQNEISLLKNRNSYLEEYIEKMHKDMQHM
mmetsp:Transcript_31907/g.28930  ORF Transcript_31907/g.28930 Transcript_31907/m.28930 type:complete len:112 (+) Transcript_31907:155-490(+)